MMSFSLNAVSQNEEKNTTSQDQKQIVITIYNENLALIKDLRNVPLDKAYNKLAWREVSMQIQPGTVILRNLTQTADFHLVELNFDFDLLTPKKLLEKYTGKEVTVIRNNPVTGDESSELATILSTNGGTILKFDDRIESNAPGRIVFPELPENLRDSPTLLMVLTTPSQGKQDLELSYLTSGLSWHTDYVAALNQDDSQLDLKGWVTLVNQSGQTYHQAKLQLLAGDIHRVRPEQRMPRAKLAMASEMVDTAQMKEESFFEYYLYTLPHLTTLADNQTKQVALMSASHIPVSKEYVLQGADYYYSGKYEAISQKLKTDIFISFVNKGKDLGIPLPKGIIRIYKENTPGASHFIGEDQIDHTPQNAPVRLKMGTAFDITADKIQTDFRQIAGSPLQGNIFETAYQVIIKNAKKEAVTVQVREPIPGDWTMLAESLPHTKLAANLAEWKVDVPAESEAALNYRVRVKY